MTKQKCAVCKRELTYYRMVLIMGPRGYRRYAFCNQCAEKIEKKNKEGRKIRKEGA